jgi:hypothetical protein
MQISRLNIFHFRRGIGTTSNTSWHALTLACMRIKYKSARHNFLFIRYFQIKKKKDLYFVATPVQLNRITAKKTEHVCTTQAETTDATKDTLSRRPAAKSHVV